MKTDHRTTMMLMLKPHILCSPRTNNDNSTSEAYKLNAFQCTLYIQSNGNT